MWGVSSFFPMNFRLCMLEDDRGHQVFWAAGGLGFDCSRAVLEFLSLEDLMRVANALPHAARAMAVLAMKRKFSAPQLFGQFSGAPVWPRMARMLWETHQFYGVSVVACDELLACSSTPLVRCGKHLAVKLGGRASYEETILTDILASGEFTRLSVFVLVGRRFSVNDIVDRVERAVCAASVLSEPPHVQLLNQNQAQFTALWNAVRDWYRRNLGQRLAGRYVHNSVIRPLESHDMARGRARG